MKNTETVKKFNLAKTQFLIRVFAVAVIFSLTAFLIILDYFKEYKARVDVLVVAKGEISSTQARDIAFNISEFPKMLSFYESMLKANPSLKDEFSGKSRDERKILWNEKVETSVGENKSGTILKLEVFADTSSKAESLVRKSVSNLIEITGTYYDMEKEVGVETVDGPFVTSVFRKTWVSIAASIAIGMFLSLILNSILLGIEKIARPVIRKTFVFSKPGEKKKNDLYKEDFFVENPVRNEEFFYDVPYDFDSPEQKEEFNTDNLKDYLKADAAYTFNDNPYPNYPEMPRTEARKASAPDNLPVAEAPDYFIEDSKKNEDTPVKEELTFVELKNEEPTRKN